MTPLAWLVVVVCIACVVIGAVGALLPIAAAKMRGGDED